MWSGRSLREGMEVMIFEIEQDDMNISRDCFASEQTRIDVP